jgi:hypothetical protein
VIPGVRTLNNIRATLKLFGNDPFKCSREKLGDEYGNSMFSIEVTGM